MDLVVPAPARGVGSTNQRMGLLPRRYPVASLEPTDLALHGIVVFVRPENARPLTIFRNILS